MKKYLRLIKFVKPHLGLLILAAILMLVSSIFDGVSLGIIIPLVDKILAGKEFISVGSTKLPAFLQSIIVYINSLSRGTLLNYIIIWALGITLIKEILVFFRPSLWASPRRL